MTNVAPADRQSRSGRIRTTGVEEDISSVGSFEVHRGARTADETERFARALWKVLEETGGKP